MGDDMNKFTLMYLSSIINESIIMYEFTCNMNVFTSIYSVILKKYTAVVKLHLLIQLKSKLIMYIIHLYLQKRLIINLQMQLVEFDKLMKRKEEEDLRKERLAIAGVNEENSMDNEGKPKHSKEDESESSSSGLLLYIFLLLVMCVLETTFDLL